MLTGIILFGSLFLWQVQGDMAQTLAQITYELERGKQAMDLSQEAIRINEKLHQRNVRSLELTRRTLLGMLVTIKITRETMDMQKKGIRLLQENLSVAKETRRQLLTAKKKTARLFQLAKQTEEASKPIQDFTLFSHQLAKKGLALAQESLDIVSGKKK